MEKMDSQRAGLLKKHRLSDTWVSVLLLLPSLAIIGGVLLYPLIDAFRISFTSLNLIGFKGKLVGFRNYTAIFQSTLYQTVLINTLVISTVAVAIRFIIGMGLALAINRTFKGKTIVRGLLILPWLIPSVVVGILWMWMLDTDIGIVNYFLVASGLVSIKIPWLADTIFSKVAVIIAFVWTGTPFIMVVMLAGLQAIPHEIVESATTDGAGRFAIFRFITLPYLRSLIAISTLLSIVYIFQNFAVIYMLTKGGPGYATEIFSLFVYEMAFNSGRLGRASAIGVTWMILLLAFSIVYVRLIAGREQTLR